MDTSYSDNAGMIQVNKIDNQNQSEFMNSDIEYSELKVTDSASLVDSKV